MVQALTKLATNVRFTLAVKACVLPGDVSSIVSVVPVGVATRNATFGSPVGNIIILVNASDVFLSDDGAISIDASREASLETVRWVAKFDFPDFERDYEFVALRHADEYPLCEGRLVSSRGGDAKHCALDGSKT